MRLVIVSCLLIAAGCGSTGEETTDGGALDATVELDSGADAREVDSARDAGSALDAGDAGSATDAALDRDAGADAASAEDAAVDAASAADAAACTGVEGPMPRGICDGRGMVGCRLWAEENAARPDNAYAICIQAGTGGCARADRCVDATDPSTCTCGGADPCKEHEVCVSDAPSGPRYCTCAIRAP